MTSFAAGGFAKGFATGFINERNRRLETEKSQDEITLRYQLEALSKKKSEWEEQQKKDSETIETAKAIGEQVGDPEFAPKAAKLLQRGIYTPQQILEEYERGGFRRKPTKDATVEVPNTERSFNRQTNVKVPLGVMAQPVSMQTLPKFF